jgi:hypothetical protein
MKIFLFWFVISLLVTTYNPVVKEKIGGIKIPVKRKSAIMDPIVKLDEFRPELSKAVFIAALIMIPIYAVAQIIVWIVWPGQGIDAMHPTTWPVYHAVIAAIPWPSWMRHGVP